MRGKIYVVDTGSRAAKEQNVKVIAYDRFIAEADYYMSFDNETVGKMQAEALVKDLTGGLGADVAIEAVGVPATFELCTSLIRPGGHVANVGVHGTAATLHLEELWIRNVTITTGLVDTYSTPTLLSLIRSGMIDAGAFITHRFTLDQFIEAYDVFGKAEQTGALKVVLTRS